VNFRGVQVSKAGGFTGLALAIALAFGLQGKLSADPAPLPSPASDWASNVTSSCGATHPELRFEMLAADAEPVRVPAHGLQVCLAVYRSTLPR
jgi:hypothetical protein